MFTEKQNIRAIELFCRDKTESRWPASCCLLVRGRFSRIGTQSAIRYRGLRANGPQTPTTIY